MCKSGPKIWLILLVVGSFLFFITQLFSGNFSGCIALKAYSYHVLSDALSLFVGLISYLALQRSAANDDEDDLPLTNTYGWVRIELVGSLISHVSIISLCFSCAVDSLQHLIDPEDGLHHHRRTMLAMGGLGIAVHLSVIFYSLVVRCCISNSGASTPRLSSTPSRAAIETPASPCSSTVTKWDAFSAHTPIPSSGFNAFCLPFLHQCCLKNNQADVGVAENGSRRVGDRSAPIVTSVSRYRLKARSQTIRNHKRGNQIDYWAMLLHMGIGLLAAIIIVIDALVHFFIDHRDHKWVHYVDPSLALIIVGIIVANITPLIIQSALTLIQHIPENIDVAALQKQLINDIPQIVQIHDIHVWRLEGKKIMATIHVVFEGIKNEQHFTKISKKIKAYFHKWDIHSLTFQPEFKPPRLKVLTVSTDSSNPNSGMPRSDTVLSTDCLYECSSPKCASDTCCGSNADRRLARITNDLPHHGTSRTHLTHRSTRDLFKETNNEDDVLEYLITKSEWRRLHRNNRWSSSAGFLTPSTSKQRVNTISSSGDIELEMIPDETLNQKRFKNKSVSSQSDGGIDKGEGGRDEVGVDVDSFKTEPRLESLDVDKSEPAKESLDDKDNKKEPIPTFVLELEMGKEDDGKNENNDELDV